MPTPHLAVSPADSTSWRVLVHVHGTSGTLTGLGVAGGPYSHRVRVTIDGQLLAEDMLAGTASAAYASSGIGVGLPFADQLVVEMQDDPTRSAIARFWAAFVTDRAPTHRARGTIAVEDGEREVVYELASEPEGERELGVLTAVGPAREAHVQLERDVVRARSLGDDGVELELEGAVALAAHGVEHALPQDRAAHVHVQRVGRTTTLGEMPVFDLGGDGARFHDKLVLPARGDYELVTNLAAYANAPTSFTVL